MPIVRRGDADRDIVGAESGEAVAELVQRTRGVVDAVIVRDIVVLHTAGFLATAGLTAIDIAVGFQHDFFKVCLRDDDRLLLYHRIRAFADILHIGKHNAADSRCEHHDHDDHFDQGKTERIVLPRDHHRT